MPAEDTFLAGGWGFAATPNVAMMGASVASNSIYELCVVRVFLYNFMDANIGASAWMHLALFRLARLSSVSGGSDITAYVSPFVLETSFPSQYITIWRDAPTYTISHTFRRIMVSIGQPQSGETSNFAWELCVPFAVVWEAGWRDINVQPLTFRPGQHFGIVCEATSPSGTTHRMGCYMELQLV